MEVQIIKTVLLLFGAIFMAFMVMATSALASNNLLPKPWRYTLLSDYEPLRRDWCRSISALSLGLGHDGTGTAGLPHILMRFFTVSDAREAPQERVLCRGFMGYFTF